MQLPDFKARLVDEIRFKEEISDDTRTDLIEGIVSTLRALTEVMRLYVCFLQDRFGQIDDELDLFEELDRVLASLAYRIREYEHAVNRLSGAIIDEEELRGSHLRLVPRSPRPNAERRDGRHEEGPTESYWVATAQKSEARVRSQLARLGVSDEYNYTFSPDGKMQDRGLISSDLSEIYADMQHLIGIIQAWSDHRPSADSPLDLLYDIKVEFSVHTVRHLLEIQKVVRWRAALC